MRPSTAPPSISAFSLSMARWLAAMVTSPARRSGRVLRRLISLRPWSQATSVSGSDDSTLSAAAKAVGAGRGAVERELRHAGRAQLEPLEGPGPSVGLKLGRDVLERTAAQHDLVGVELDLRRDRRLRDRGKARAQRRQDALRLGIVPARQLVGIDLARRQHRAQQRRGAEPESPTPPSFSALSSGPKLASICSNLAPAGSALSFAVSFQGVGPACPPS